MRRSSRFVLVMLAVAGLVPLSSGHEQNAIVEAAPLVHTTPVTGAVITGTTSITFYVSNQATNGYSIDNDSNAGTTKPAPLLTINEAACRANRNQAGVGTPTGPVGTLIKMNDGSYHEFIDRRGNKRVFETASHVAVSYATVDARVPVILEAEKIGAVRVEGADATNSTGLDGWQREQQQDAEGDERSKCCDDSPSRVFTSCWSRTLPTGRRGARHHVVLSSPGRNDDQNATRSTCARAAANAASGLTLS